MVSENPPSPEKKEREAKPAPAPEGKERTRERPPLRETLRNEAKERLQVVYEDSEAFQRASLAIGAFLNRILDAARMIENELKNNNQLTIKEIEQYESFLTEAEANAIILPRLLQQIRVTQYSSGNQKQLEDIFRIIVEREKLLEKIETARGVILKGSVKEGGPIPKEVITQLIPIATTAWMLREKLAQSPELTDPQKKALQDLEKSHADAEKAYTRKTQEAGKSVKEAGRIADEERRTAGAERVTQGFPGATLILDTPEISMASWERLLIDGGPKEKIRYARQLRESISEFQKDFLELRALESFRDEAKKLLEKNIKPNERRRILSRALKFFGFEREGKQVESMEDFALTNRKEFEEIFQSVMKKVGEKFEEIRKMPEAKMCAELMKVLQKIENKDPVETKRLQELLKAYAILQRETGSILASVQQWQIEENVDRVGGQADSNMLDQVTRIQGQPAFSYLRNAAPYGVFRTRSYRDEKGRIILVVPPQESEVLWHLKEGGKSILAINAARLLPTFHGMLMRVPLLGRVFRPLYLRLGIPATLAVTSIVGAKAGADARTMENAVGVVGQEVAKLEKGAGKLTQESVEPVADNLFEHLLMALQAAEGIDPTRIDRNLALDAHLYTNQILTALDYPPYHKLRGMVMPLKVNEKMSEEVREYVLVRAHERRGVHEETRRYVEQFRLQMLGDRGRRVKSSPVDDLLSNEKLPRLPNKDALERLLVDAMRSPEFREAGGKMDQVVRSFGKTEIAQGEAIFALSARVVYTLAQLKDLDYKYRKGRAGDIHQSIPKEELVPIDKEVAHLIHEVPIMHILTAAKHLETHEPSNADIANWLHLQRPEGYLKNFLNIPSSYFDATLTGKFGEPGNRNVGKKVLDAWVDLWDYAKMYVPEEAKRK